MISTSIEKVPNVAISVIDGNGQTVYTGVTSSDGTIEFAKVTPGA